MQEACVSTIKRELSGAATFKFTLTQKQSHKSSRIDLWGRWSQPESNSFFAPAPSDTQYPSLAPVGNMVAVNYFVCPSLFAGKPWWKVGELQLLRHSITALCSCPSVRYGHGKVSPFWAWYYLSEAGAPSRLADAGRALSHYYCLAHVLALLASVTCWWQKWQILGDVKSVSREELFITGHAVWKWVAKRYGK